MMTLGSEEPCDLKKILINEEFLLFFYRPVLGVSLGFNRDCSVGLKKYPS
jgi:hypothetical protein